MEINRKGCRWIQMRERPLGITKLSLLSLTAGLLIGNYAFAQDVRYNFDRDTDFSKFKTYKWVSIGTKAQTDTLRGKQIEKAVDVELSGKGLTRIEDDTADLYIGYQTAIGQEHAFTSYNSSWGYGPGWYRGGWYGYPGGGMTTGQTSTIYTGQLDLDMYDSANHDLVWRGVASKTIDTNAKPDKQQKNLTKAVVKLLRNYPPKVKK
jgi:hypothetical protein